MKIATLGIDLAKDAFQVHAVDERGQTVLRMADGGKPAVRARYIDLGPATYEWWPSTPPLQPKG